MTGVTEQSFMCQMFMCLRLFPIFRRVPPCAVKTCAVRPVFAWMLGELRAADPSNVQGPVKQNACPGEQSEGPRKMQSSSLFVGLIF